MQFKWLQIFCLCAAIQFQFIEGNQYAPQIPGKGSNIMYNNQHQFTPAPGTNSGKQPSHRPGEGINNFNYNQNQHQIGAGPFPGHQYATNNQRHQIEAGSIPGHQDATNNQGHQIGAGSFPGYQDATNNQGVLQSNEPSNYPVDGRNRNQGQHTGAVSFPYDRDATNNQGHQIEAGSYPGYQDATNNQGFAPASDTSSSIVPSHRPEDESNNFNHNNRQDEPLQNETTTPREYINGKPVWNVKPHNATTTRPVHGDKNRSVTPHNATTTRPVNGDENRRSQPTNHICTRSTEYYDCQIRDVHLKKGELMDFGQKYHNPERNLTFVDSTLDYLPKSLIDAFPNMTLLNLNDLKIASIDPNAFEHAAKLVMVFLEGNRLIRIDRDAFRGANNLQILVLSNNEITHIDNQAFDSNTGLQSLNLDRNRLEELPSFEKAAGLQFLNASHNNLVSIDDGHFRQLRYLQIIDLSFNRLERLNLQQLNANFELVDVSCNDLIDFVMPKYVKILYARNNSITQFEVGQQCQLREVDLAHNKLDTQPMFENCKSLEYLDLSYNLLETFVYKKSMDKLQTINLAHNNLFEIQIPIKTAIPSFKKLDLSHNKLTHISSLDAFKNLEWLLLNNNKLITFNKTIKSFPNAIQMAMANNEWNCDDIKYFESKTMDKHNNHCATGQENRNGICCRAYSKPYNDRLNEVLREAYLHERENQKKCSKPVSALSNQNTYLDEIRNAMANADTEKRNKLEEIKKVKLKQNKLEASVKEFQEKQDRLANSKVNVAREIERQRQSHRVTKEGLISDKEMLERIIKFVTERDAFNKDLLSRRQNDTEESNNLHGEKQREFDELNRTIEKLKKHITSLKQEEKNQKRVKDLLEKKVNKNSASIHGSSGTISQ